MTKLILNF